MRLSTACDQCKSRKVKCDGTQPCSHCQRRKGDTCRYTPTLKRALPGSGGSPPAQRHRLISLNRSSHSPEGSSTEEHQPQYQGIASTIDDDETVVPRDSRLLQDAQGKLMFIGDCAPLSFLQSVRHLVTAFISSDKFASQPGCDALLEQSDGIGGATSIEDSTTLVSCVDIETAVLAFTEATSGLLDVGAFKELVKQVKQWKIQAQIADDMFTAVNQLVLAIGLQSKDESLALRLYHKARSIALARLSFDTSPLTVQAFLLVSVFMLRNCQPNGSYLYFSLAARASYSIGMHRTEVNMRLGFEAQKQRERLYKSLKTTDLLISMCLGRPPALYDVDCTVKYGVSTVDEAEASDALDDVIQVLLVVETIVEEVYTLRKKISLQLTKQISQRLKKWAEQRMSRLNSLVRKHGDHQDISGIIGACQALATYYYAVMLLSKPFLMYEAFRTLGQSGGSHIRNAASTGRRALAEGCVDAACCLVDMVSSLTRTNTMSQKMPLIVSWVFTAALTLGVALAGGFGRIMERYLKDAVAILEYFSRQDSQAMQYSHIAKSLLATCIEHIQRQELSERLERVKASSDLFGIQVGTFNKPLADDLERAHPQNQAKGTFDYGGDPSLLLDGFATPEWEDFDLGAFGELPADANGDTFGALNLFPMFGNL